MEIYFLSLPYPSAKMSTSGGSTPLTAKDIEAGRRLFMYMCGLASDRQNGGRSPWEMDRLIYEGREYVYKPLFFFEAHLKNPVATPNSRGWMLQARTVGTIMRKSSIHSKQSEIGPLGL